MPSLKKERASGAHLINPEAQEQESQILAVCVQHWLGEEGSIGPGQESDVPYCGQGQLRLPVSHAIMYVNHNSLFTLSTLLINWCSLKHDNKETLLEIPLKVNTKRIRTVSALFTTVALALRRSFTQGLIALVGRPTQVTGSP